MSTSIEVLEFSRDLVKNGWTRGVFAEDRQEQEVDPEDPNACSFCVLGAFNRAKHVLQPTGSAAEQANKALHKSMPTFFMHLVEFNDAQCSEEPVVDLFDRAIASLKESA